MQKLTFILSLLLGAAILQSATAFAALNLANGKTIFNEGKGDAAACMGCHGEKGLGNDAMGAARLANIGQAYLVKQLNDFATDKRVAPGMGEVMNGFSKALSEQDRRDLAVYLDTLDYELESSDLKALAAEGQKIGRVEIGEIIVTYGIKGRLPACQDCHGFNGRDPRFPAINQQKYVYLVNQLNYWRDGSRSNDPKVGKIGIMQGIAQKFTDDDILDMAAYLSTAPRVAPKENNRKK